MLPKNTLGRKTLSKLKVYAGPTTRTRRSSLSRTRSRRSSSRPRATSRVAAQ
jgi:ribosomal protein L13